MANANTTTTMDIVENESDHSGSSENANNTNNAEGTEKYAGLILGIAYNLLAPDDADATTMDGGGGDTASHLSVEARWAIKEAQLAGRDLTSAERQMWYHDDAVKLRPSDVSHPILNGRELYLDHDTDAAPVGHIVRGWVEGKRLHVLAQLKLDTPAGRKALDLVNSGEYKSLSVGYMPHTTNTGKVVARAFNELSLVRKPYFPGCDIQVLASNEFQPRKPPTLSPCTSEALMQRKAHEVVRRYCTSHRNHSSVAVANTAAITSPPSSTPTTQYLVNGGILDEMKRNTLEYKGVNPTTLNKPGATNTPSNSFPDSQQVNNAHTMLNTTNPPTAAATAPEGAGTVTSLNVKELMEQMAALKREAEEAQQRAKEAETKNANLQGEVKVHQQQYINDQASNRDYVLKQLREVASGDDTPLDTALETMVKDYYETQPLKPWADLLTKMARERESFRTERDTSGKQLTKLQEDMTQLQSVYKTATEASKPTIDSLFNTEPMQTGGGQKRDRAPYTRDDTGRFTSPAEAGHESVPMVTASADGSKRHRFANAHEENFHKVLNNLLADPHNAAYNTQCKMPSDPTNLHM